MRVVRFHSASFHLRQGYGGQDGGQASPRPQARASSQANARCCTIAPARSAHGNGLSGLFERDAVLAARHGSHAGRRLGDRPRDVLHRAPRGAAEAHRLGAGVGGRHLCSVLGVRRHLYEIASAPIRSNPAVTLSVSRPQDIFGLHMKVTLVAAIFFAYAADPHASLLFISPTSTATRSLRDSVRPVGLSSSSLPRRVRLLRGLSTA